MTSGAAPDMAEPFDLTSTDVDSFREKGHLLLRNVASAAEIKAYRGAINSTVSRLTTETRPIEERETVGKAFFGAVNLWRLDSATAKFVLAGRFARIAATLLGVDRVRLYHDQALFKEPGGGYTPWHQDAVYWPLDGHRCLTMWMPLIDIKSDMGGMSFASQTNQGPLIDLKISDASEEYLTKLICDGRYPIVGPVDMMRGDATFHAGWTAHRAMPNGSKVMREVMTIIWYADGLIVKDPTPNQEADLHAWFPGLGPGDVAATDLNPLLPQ